VSRGKNNTYDARPRYGRRQADEFTEAAMETSGNKTERTKKKIYQNQRIDEGIFISSSTPMALRRPFTPRVVVVVVRLNERRGRFIMHTGTAPRETTNDAPTHTRCRFVYKYYRRRVPRRTGRVLNTLLSVRHLNRQRMTFAQRCAELCVCVRTRPRPTAREEQSRRGRYFSRVKRRTERMKATGARNSTVHLNPTRGRAKNPATAAVSVAA